MDFNNLLLMRDMFDGDVDEAEEEMESNRVVLTQTNPFEALSEYKFIQRFRLSKNMVQEVIEMVEPFVVQPSRRSALSTTTKVLAALRFFASGCHQEVTGSNHFVAISQPSMCRALTEIVNALNQPAILNAKIKFPSTQEERGALRTRFFHKYGFPGIMGVIDCTHVAIVAPAADPDHPEHVYINRKHYHSLNVQLICDTDLRILNINSRFPGSAHDAFIWSQSPVSRCMERVYRGNPNNALFLIGDSGYPTRPWLLTPLPNPVTPEQERFNDRFRSIRSLIERCNGVLKNRFRCLLKYRTLHYGPVMAGKIANACAVLHNMCIDNNIPEVNERHPEPEPDYGMYPPNLDGVQRVAVNADLVAARELQQNIINTHF